MNRTSVNCPICKRVVVWSPESPFRPFCSERCQLIDLGEWMLEGRSIEAKDEDEDAMPWQPDQDH